MIREARRCFADGLFWLDGLLLAIGRHIFIRNVSMKNSGAAAPMRVQALDDPHRSLSVVSP